tara:strand:+ start:90 stop:272 length:183 start_codon:yes stop_codon:yes gene_type:complete
VLYPQDKHITSDMTRISENWPRIFGKENMKRLGYNIPEGTHFLVYEVEQILDDAFAGMRS